MKVYIGYQSAIEFWRINRALPGKNARQQRSIKLPCKPPPAEQVRSAGLTCPVHILLSDQNRRWASGVMIQHLFTGEAPEGCFISAKDILELSSPEFSFLQMSGRLSLVKLVELGYELCGTYSLPVSGDNNVPDRGFNNRLPLTNVRQLSEFVSCMTGVKGLNKTAAIRALRYIIDGSASPMETKLAMLLTLPYKLGGFGFPKPKLNSRIIPSKTERKSSNKSFYSCDYFWPDHNTAVEYDSAQFHTGSSHITDDSNKRIFLMSMGITPITVTTQQLYDSYDFERVARVIAKCLGKRLAYKNPGFAAAHRKLREQLRIESGWSQ